MFKRSSRVLILINNTVAVIRDGILQYLFEETTFRDGETHDYPPIGSLLFDSEIKYIQSHEARGL